MLETAYPRIAKKGPDSHVKVQIDDLVHLSFAAACFDAHFLSFVLELFALEIPQIPTECRRMRKRGRRAGIVPLSKASGTNGITNRYDWGHDMFPQVLDCHPTFVQKAVEEAGPHTKDAERISWWTLPIEVGVRRKQD
jgi:ubiquinone/menaquinone biosynthesis C-methylase UbiE